MAIYYDLQGKTGHAEPITKGNGRYNTRKDSYLAMKKIIEEHCDINPELCAISRENLPSPKYRASVIRYLKIFFKTERHPSYEIIDYSDYGGKIRTFPPVRDAEEEEYATGYEKKMGIVEYYDYEDNNDITSYDKELGFIFSVGKFGMHLQFLGTTKPGLNSRYMFQNCTEGLAFNFEPGNGDKRVALDLRSFKNTGEKSVIHSGSFYTVMLLNILLQKKETCPVSLHENDKLHDDYDEPDSCLMFEMESEIYKKINDDFNLTSDLKPSAKKIEDDINRLKAFGYNINEEILSFEEINCENKAYIRKMKKYYISPFVCKKDSNVIIDCIKKSNMPQFSKSRLIEKFKSEIGYHRFSKDDFEESTMPMPFHRDKGDEWSAGYYSLIIYNLLRLCARPLPISSKKKESIQDLAEKYYGGEIDRKKAIPNNAAAMVAMGLPIQKVDGKYCFDTSKLLSKDDMNDLVKCITESNIAESEKKRLIKKLDEKFPIGKY